MALNRFKDFLKKAPVEDDRPVIAVQDQEKEVFHKSPDYTRRFARHAWKAAAAAAVLTASAGAGLAWMNTHGAKDLGPWILTSALNVPYQFLERSVLGKQAGLDQQREALVDLDQKGHDWGVYTKRPSITVNYYHPGDADANSTPDDTCAIEVSMDEHGRVTSIGRDGGLFDEQNNPKAIELHRNFVMGHEDAHCTFADEMAPLRGTSLPAATEKVLNDWVVGPSANENGLKGIFNETQADVVGLQVMLKMAGFNADAWKEVSNDEYDRKGVQNMEEAWLQAGNDVHRTYPALQEMLNHREEVQRRPASEYRNYAYAAASRSLLDQMDAGHVRAGAAEKAHVENTNKSDPLRQGKTVIGALGINAVNAILSRDGMRDSVSEQALEIQEERLGLRVRKAGIEDTLPRKMAEAWIAAENPFKPNKEGVMPVTMVDGPNGVVARQFAGKKGHDGWAVFYGKDRGAPAFQTEAAFKVFEKSLGLADVRADMARALHATPEQVAQIIKDAPLYDGAKIQPMIPTLKGLGAKIDARQPVQGAVMVPPAVSARKSLTM